MRRAFTWLNSLMTMIAGYRFFHLKSAPAKKNFVAYAIMAALSYYAWKMA